VINNQLSSRLKVMSEDAMKIWNVMSVIIVTGMFIGVTSFAFAGNDSSIKGQQRLEIKTAMGVHISGNSLAGKYVIFDAGNGAIKKLTLKELHQGVVKKGDYYVSCADFVDAKGKLYDLDFLVANKAGKYQVIQSLVHAIDGKKRKYHVEG
jgi:hypothetical protein